MYLIRLWQYLRTLDYIRLGSSNVQEEQRDLHWAADYFIRRQSVLTGGGGGKNHQG